MENKIVIEGVVSKEDPQLKHFQKTGDPYTRFAIWWSSNAGKGYFTLCAYGEKAVRLVNEVGAGDRIKVTGRLKSWKSKEGKSFTDILIETLESVQKKQLTEDVELEVE